MVELVEKLKKFTYIKSIGSGTKGVIKLYKIGKKYQVIKETLHNNLFPVDSIREISVLLKFKSSTQIIQINDFQITENKSFILMDYYDLNLQEWIEQNDFNTRIYSFHHIFTTLLRTIYDFHYHKVIHNDLKTNNILLKIKKTSIIEISLSDFGWSKKVYNPNNMKYNGITFFQNPNIKNVYYQEYWAFFVMMTEYLVGYNIFLPDDDVIQKKDWIKEFYRINIFYNKKQLIDFLSKFITIDQINKFPSFYFDFFQKIQDQRIKLHHKNELILPPHPLITYSLINQIKNRCIRYHIQNRYIQVYDLLNKFLYKYEKLENIETYISIIFEYFHIHRKTEYTFSVTERDNFLKIMDYQIF